MPSFPKREQKKTDKTLHTKVTHTSATTSNSDTAVAVNETTVLGDFQNLDEQIQSMITKSDQHASFGNGRQGFLATCNVCGKEAAYQNMPRHVEANHITGVSHECDICGKISRSAHGLRQHKTNYHMATTGSTV